MKTILLLLILILHCIVFSNAQNNQSKNSTTITNNNNNNSNKNNNNNSTLNNNTNNITNSNTDIFKNDTLPFIRNYSIVDSYRFPEVILLGRFLNSNKPYLVIDGAKHNDFKILEIKGDVISQIGFIHPHKHSANFSVEYDTNGLKSNVVNVQVKSKIYEHYTDQLTNELVLEGIFIYQNKTIFPEVSIGENSLMNENVSCTITKSTYYSIRCLLPFKYGCKNGIKISNVYDYSDSFTNIQICALKPKIEKIIATVNEWEKEFIVTAIGDHLGKGAWLNLKTGSSQLLDVNADNKVIEYIYNNGSETYECVKMLSSNNAYVSCKFPYEAYKEIKRNHKDEYNYVSVQQPGTFYTNKQVNYEMLQLEYLDYDNIILVLNTKYGRLVPLVAIPVLVFLIIAFIVLIIVVIVLKKKYDGCKKEINQKKNYKDPFADPFA
ncbi:hypothetical protein DICPUDRAFT_158785 [Dictyostelium purpureum]|uniref:IPT/TIG domain-containing protein n=1 Tax=Dictyostelium purpureum TaxID=5786 RepID=F1A2H1_DICPU|nr:uncharacterized protein DICPUDRAFT_158785 [Dictyostelium purpureum]EGC29612.1 hypothetical protein DICPUDRAFT_158785 [Dictyostelium purpureum]|eukprot:XP_003293863.1 hypothetical protein DICPUDRAFT_158785 [Dictyostelium purpureum]